MEDERLLGKVRPVNTSNDEILRRLKGKLIVSCQASPGDPLDHLDTLSRMVQSVLMGGAGGLRAEGAERITKFRSLTSVPIIGLIKTTDCNSAVYITPDFRCAADVSAAGAEIVALDCTLRRLIEAEPWPPLIGRIRAELGRVVCADIATLDDALAAEQAGADLVATTLRGYTADSSGVRAVDFDFVENLLRNLNIPVVVEGHVTRPEEVTQALRLGAHAVVVGSAITRPQTITARYVAATLFEQKGTACELNEDGRRPPV